MTVKGAGKALGLWLLVFSVLGAVPCGAVGQDIRFTGQVIVGTAGGALFGLVGNWVGTRICEITAEEGANTGELCWLPGVYGYLAGVPLGASLGVGLAGTSLGAQGDYLLAAAGAVVGEALGVGVLMVLRGTLESEEAFFAAAYGLVPFLSAAFAATGYNMDVRSGYTRNLSRIFTSFALSEVVLPGG
jgi:hypothetical protein